MDTRKFATGLYLKAADVQDGMIKQIINVSESDGKFGPKLDIWFLDGNRLSLSGTNVGELHRAYGTELGFLVGQKRPAYRQGLRQ